MLILLKRLKVIAYSVNKQNDHIQRAGRARVEYRFDKDRASEIELVYSGDLEKVVYLPRAPGVKNVIFTQRLGMYTFCLVGETSQDFNPVFGMMES